MSRIDGGLRALFAERLPAFHWQSVETGLTGRGVPDSNYCYAGVEGWCEFKFTQGLAVPIRPEQIGWHMRRHRAGGRTFIVVRRTCAEGPRRAAADELYLYTGADARDLRAVGLRMPPLRLYEGGPARWDWAGVALVLTHIPRERPAGPRS